MMVSVRPEQARGEFPVVELPKIFFLKSKIQFFFFFFRLTHFFFFKYRKWVS